MRNIKSRISLRQDRSSVLYLGACFLLLSFAMSIAAIYCINAQFFELEWPYTSSFETPKYWLNDLIRSISTSAGENPYHKIRLMWGGENFFYGPGTYVVYRLLDGSHFLTVNLYLLVVPLFFLLTLMFCYLKPVLGKGQSALLACVFVLCAFPIWYELDRGNLDIFVFAIAWLVFLLLDKGRNKGYSFIIGSLLGSIVAMKFYPVVFLPVALKLSRNKFALFFGFCFAIVALFLMVDVNPVEQMRYIAHELDFTKQCYTSYEACPGNSLLFMTKTFGAFLGWDIQKSVYIYRMFAAVLVAIYGYCLLRNNDEIELFFQASVLVVLLAVMSANYKLVMLIPFLGLALYCRSYAGFLVMQLGCILVLSFKLFDSEKAYVANALVLFASFILISMHPYVKNVRLVRVFGPKVLTLTLCVIFSAQLFAYANQFNGLFLSPNTVFIFDERAKSGLLKSGFQTVETDGNSYWAWTSGSEAKINFFMTPRDAKNVKLFLSSDEQSCFDVAIDLEHLAEYRCVDQNTHEITVFIPEHLSERQLKHTAYFKKITKPFVLSGIEIK